MFGDLLTALVETAVHLADAAGQLLDLCREHRWFRRVVITVVVAAAAWYWLF